MARFETDERDLSAQGEDERTHTHSTRDVSDLLVSLDADDPKRRASAAWSLAKVAASTPERVPISDLSQAVTDDDPWVRRGATWALAEVAQVTPSGARPAMERACDLVDDEDQLVRENAVVAVASVAAEYPRSAQPALDSLLELRDVESGLLRRYATEALRHVVDSIAGATLEGDPVVISVGDPGLVDVLPAGANVVQIDGADDESNPLRVESASEVKAEAESTPGTTKRHPPQTGTGPPSLDDLTSPSALPVTYRDFEKLRSLGRSPLVTVERARASTPREQHAMVTLFTLHPDRRGESVSESFATAIDRWEAIDDHDHVLSMRARGDTPPWVATEFADAGTLSDHLDAAFDASLWFARCIVRTVSHAHALGVIHGGLCPPAIRFIGTFGPTWPVPKVGDWGFADVTVDFQLPPVPPAYAAPEHLEPDTFGGIDHSTDVYGLGTVLYALFTGTAPFSDAPHLVVKQVTAEAPPTPTSMNPDLPDSMDELLERALAKRKSDRYETVDDALVALDHVISGYSPDLMGRIA